MLTGKSTAGFIICWCHTNTKLTVIFVGVKPEQILCIIKTQGALIIKLQQDFTQSTNSGTHFTAEL